MGRVEVTNLAETYSPAPKYLYTIEMCIFAVFLGKNHLPVRTSTGCGNRDQAYLS